ncbi:MAG: caspase family protein [Gemmataceae bacterium]
MSLRCWASTFLLMAVSLAQAVDPPAGKKYAVLVGINQYQHAKLPALRYAVNDATELAELLRKSGYTVTLLTDDAGAKDSQFAPTKKNIETSLKGTLAQAQRADTVVIALAGHGLQFASQQDAYFCPSDARPLPEATASLVSLHELYQHCEQSFAGVKVLLVDACRDDPTAARGARGVDADSAPRPPRGVAALFSCSAGERAFENDKLKHGLFFHYVLQGMRGEAKDADDEVNFNGLSSYVCKQVARQAGVVIGGGARQSPNLKADLSGESPVLLRATSSNSDTVADQAFEEGRNLYKGLGVEKNYRRAFEKFQIAAKAGDARAMNYIGHMYEHDEGVVKDQEEALRWYRKAAEAGNKTAMTNLGLMFEYGRGMEKEFPQALAWFQKAADQGDGQAMMNIGLMHELGRGVPQNNVEAIQWYRNAADVGYLPAMTSLGFMYENGKGVEKNLGESLRWYRRAADKGDARAMFLLGNNYDIGRGVAKDDSLAAQWYLRGAEAGHSTAMYNIGVMYEFGRGTKQDMIEAVRWYRKSAELGDLLGMASLANMFAQGKGVEKDEVQSARWCRKAAEAGSTSAMHTYGVKCQYGLGVAQDYQEAMRWYRKAADAGLATSFVNIGYMYENGLGVPKDTRESLVWFRKGAAAGDGAAMHNLGVTYERGQLVPQDLNVAIDWYRKAAAKGIPESKAALQKLGVAQ